MSLLLDFLLLILFCEAQIMTLKSKLDHANKRCEKLEKEIRGDKDEPKKEGDGKCLQDSS